MIRDRIKELRRVKGSELLANPKNFRRHDDYQTKVVQSIIERIGWAAACIAREDRKGNLILIDGHLRSSINPDAMIPVLILDVTKKEADELLATLDPVTELASLDSDSLTALLGDVRKGAKDETQLSFIDHLLSECVVEPAEIVEDEVPETPKRAVTKPGDLWTLGRHRLLCGDSTKEEDVAKCLGGAKPFITVTDPPYGVEYDPQWRDRVLQKVNRRTGKVTHDDRKDWSHAYQHFPGLVAYVWHAGRHAADIIVGLRDAHFEIYTQIIWRKPQIVFGRGHYHWQHEPCWYAVRKGGSAKWGGGRTQSTIWDIQHLISRIKTNGTVDEFTEHSTQKPVECMARPIRNHGDKDDHVYDPFLGSGTTLIAAEQLERRCFSLEIEPRYCDVVVERWQNLTGKKAKRKKRRT